MSVDNFLLRYTSVFDDNIERFVPKSDVAYSSVINAVNYSLTAGGKRIRPALLMEFCRIFCDDYCVSIPAACAIEMIHTYSLIHDDLPCMDNDDFRRGKPSCHISFGEDIALLAGDGLQSLAFETMTRINIDSDKIVKSIACLAECCGINGMVGGQVIDLESENKQISHDTLIFLQRLKTGKLIEAAAKIGCILGGANDEEISLCLKYAENIGLAFQIRDDILDVIGDEELLGKPIGSDKEENKSTFLSFMSIEEAENKIHELTERAKESLSFLGDKANDLCDLADYLAFRNK
ncbi:MAG: polyprenyl synthetase family protein [Clostridia bacterium]|nr:polyprenyl synthetase family protein [Clostridia bacterium]